MPFEGRSIIVAVSGGADSVSLLLALAELRRRKKLAIEIVAAHFNHKLREAESDRDEEFVRSLAGSLGFEFVRGEMKNAVRSDIEQTARNARYKFLAKQAEQRGGAPVLTAHTINDQAETLLMNLIRGSGAAGLGGMRPVRRLETGRRNGETAGDAPILVRPLLRWAKREDTKQFCLDSGVEYRKDEMNDDTRFTRVRIRKEVIPLLAEFNPKIIETLARTAGLLSERGGALLSIDTESLTLKDLQDLPPNELYEILRSWLAKQRGDLRTIDLKHITAIKRLIRSRKSGRTVELPGFCRVTKQKGRLFFEKIKVEK